MATYMTRCTHCSEKLEVEEEWTGKKAVCPACKREFTIQPKLSIKGKTTEGKSPISQSVPPPPENASKGLRPPKKRRRFFGKTFRIIAACLLIPTALAAAGYYTYQGIMTYLFENSGFHLAETSSNAQIYISGHGLFMKVKNNVIQQEAAPQPQPTSWEETLNHTTPTQSYSEQIRQRNTEKRSFIESIFSENYTGVIYMPEQNMSWGKLEVKNGKADGAFRTYRFRSGRETLTNELIFKDGRLIKFTDFPRMGKGRIIYIHYDLLGRFTHATENKKIIAKAQYDKFSRLNNIVIQYQEYRIVQHYQKGKIIRE